MEAFLRKKMKNVYNDNQKLFYGANRGMKKRRNIILKKIYNKAGDISNHQIILLVITKRSSLKIS